MEKLKPRAMLRTILVDDEKNSLTALELEIRANCPDVEVVATCRSPEEGIDQIRALKPDLVFLDIQMPVMNGFEMLEKLDVADFAVIFCTAFDEYSMQAIKVSAMDYLLKPVDSEQLVKAVKKVTENVALKRTKEQMDFLLTNLSSSTSRGFSKIALPTLKGLDFVNVTDIFYCAAEGNYTSIHMSDGGKFVISRTLSEFEEMLDDSIFFRTHKSFLVNLEHIKQYIKGSGGQVILRDGTSIQVARARKEVLLNRIYPK